MRLVGLVAENLSVLDDDCEVRESTRWMITFAHKIHNTFCTFNIFDFHVLIQALMKITLNQSHVYI